MPRCARIPYAGMAGRKAFSPGRRWPELIDSGRMRGVTYFRAVRKRRWSPPHPSRLTPCHPLQQERAFLCPGGLLRRFLPLRDRQLGGRGMPPPLHTMAYCLPPLIRLCSAKPPSPRGRLFSPRRKILPLPLRGDIFLPKNDDRPPAFAGGRNGSTSSRACQGRGFARPGPRGRKTPQPRSEING